MFLASWGDLNAERFQLPEKQTLLYAKLTSEILTDATNPPDIQSSSGKTSFPVSGSMAGRISNTVRMLAIISQMVASAMKRPGQILNTHY